MKLLVVGFPYVRERYFVTWRHVPEPEHFRFLLPSRWTAKQGRVVFTSPEDPRIRTTRTFFHDSHAPLIGGLLKGWMPAFPWHLWRMRRSVRLVYACSEPTLLTTLYFAFFSKLFGKKFVCFTWENSPYEKKLRGLSYAIHYALLTINLALADGLICGNPEGLEIHRKYMDKPIAVIPMNGLDPEFFSLLQTTNYKLQTFAGKELDGKIIFTFIGAIGYRKGIHLAIRALPEVLKKVPNAHLVIAGNGEYEEELDRQLETTNYKLPITRIPWLDDQGVRALLSRTQVFLYPSIPHGGWAEQFGYSMAEASLMEVPVIATRSGSIPYVVKDGETGILVEPNDASSLADAMVRLGTDEALRRRLGEQGREYISEQFSHKAIAKRFFHFFELIND